MNVGDRVRGIKGDVVGKKGTVISVVFRRGTGSNDRVWLTVKNFEGYSFSAPEEDFGLLYDA